MIRRAGRSAAPLLAAALIVLPSPALKAASPTFGKDGGMVLPALAFPPSPPAFGEAVDGAAAASEPDATPPAPSPAPSKRRPDDAAAGAKPTARTICRLIARNADAVGMPKDFFARLIWKESRFDVKAVSPVGAQGIAQFMPYTAAERGLDDPYNLRDAIRHSAEYLADLRAELGNWGLAAAAYNGGINRVKGWILNGGSLPFETEAYVSAITFRPADWFKEDGHEVEHHPLQDGRDFLDGCSELPVMKTRSMFGQVAGVDSAPMKPWGVQVAGNENRSIAMRMWQRVQAAHPAILSDKPIVMRERTSPRRTIYAVRIGRDSRSQADELCGRLKSAGGFCIVLKN
ncbi:transglycosylase SLT domain-containing protein [Jiella sp. M17.18]|uniref:transglycosylase SLT domain-containing protein n=1 Tax=Jiella sp. M17.18 TaxID=3234247 RepID=UPI0034E048FF